MLGVDYDSEDRTLASLPFTEESIGANVTYTVVGCGYTDRIPLAEVPGAFWASEALSGADAAEHAAIVKQSGVDTYGAVLYHGFADVDHLMSFRHCAAFTHSSLYKAEVVEITVKEKAVAILYLRYETSA